MEWQLFYDMTNSKLRSGKILHIQQRDNHSSLCGRDVNYGLPISFPVATPICPNCAEIKVEQEAAENAGLTRRVRELEAENVRLRDFVTEIANDRDDTVSPGTKAQAQALLASASADPAPVQPLDTEYTSEMSYYGGYSNSFRLVKAGSDPHYWIIAVKQDHMSDGESIMYRYDSIDEALPEFLNLCKHFDTTTIELNTGSEAAPVVQPLDSGAEVSEWLCVTCNVYIPYEANNGHCTKCNDTLIPF